MNRRLINAEGGVYHVMSRITRREMLLKAKEKEMFTSLMWKQAAFSGLEVITFCLMDNHFHILLRVIPIDSLPDSELCKRYQEFYGEGSNPQSAVFNS